MGPNGTFRTQLVQLGSNGSIGVTSRGPKKRSKIIMNSIGWSFNPGLLGHVLFICISVYLKTVFLMVQKWKHGFEKDSWYTHGLMVWNQTYGTEMESWYRHRLRVQIWTHGIDMDSQYWQRLMVWIQTHGVDNTHGIDLNSWYSIGTTKSHTYKRAQCCPYEEFFLKFKTPYGWRPQYYGRSRQCGCPVGARCSMGLGKNPLINSLIQHTFKLNFSQ